MQELLQSSVGFQAAFFWSKLILVTTDWLFPRCSTFFEKEPLSGDVNSSPNELVLLLLVSVLRALAFEIGMRRIK